MTIFHLIMNPTDVSWVQNQMENSYYDRIPFSLRVIRNEFSKRTALWRISDLETAHLTRNTHQIICFFSNIFLIDTYITSLLHVITRLLATQQTPLINELTIRSHI